MHPILIPVIQSLATNIIDGFIEDKKPTTEEVISEDYENVIIDWLDNHIDIPFVSDEHEREVIAAVVNVVKVILIQKINPI